jgi:phosphoribosylformylglycinamidine (FGAM) synthase-like enzyme
VAQSGLLGFGGNTGAGAETEVRISVNHKDAVQDQTPFEGGSLMSALQSMEQVASTSVGTTLVPP